MVPMMFYYLHSMSVVHVNIVSANLSLCLPPKSGDTSLMHWLYELHTGGRQWDARKCTHLYDPEYRGGNCWLVPGKLRFGTGGRPTPDSWRVAVIRDPVARAISAWKSKYACDGVWDDGKLVPTPKRYTTRGPEGHKGACFSTDLMDRARNVGNQMTAFGLRQYVSHDLSAGGSCLAFESFLQVVANLSSTFGDASRVQPSLDVHLMSQATMCGITNRDLKAGLVTLVDLETISQPSSPFMRVQERLHAFHPVPNLHASISRAPKSACPPNPSASPPNAAAWQLLRSFYQHDYQVLYKNRVRV